MSCYKVIIPIGLKCFTEIYLKKLGYKNFSCPFDAIFSKSIDDIIYLFENKIEYNKLIHTENIQNEIINTLNNTYGFRTIHSQLNTYDENDYTKTFHLATFAHHNLNDDNIKEHFNRCFKRIDIIKEQKIKTLFCLFIHKCENYSDIPFEKVISLKNYLIEHFNCDLFVGEFYHDYTSNYNWNIKYNENNLIYIHINNNSNTFSDNEKCLNEIFNYFLIDKSQLLTYNEIAKFI